MTSTRLTRGFESRKTPREVLIVLDNAPARVSRVQKVARTLKHEGYSVRVAYPRGLETLREYQNVPIPSIIRPSLVHYMVFTLSLFFYLVRDPPDAVHFVNLPDMAVFGIILARKLRHFRFIYDRMNAFGLIVERRHRHWGLLAKAAENFAFRNADAIIVERPAFQRELERYASKLFLVPNGVNLADFRPRKARPRGAPMVLIVAALTYIEGIDVFIRAAKAILDRGLKAHFVVVGDGDYAGQLRKLSRELNDPVHFAGWVPFKKVPLVMNAAEICVSCVLPTNFTDNAHPMKLFEYLACRKPIIVSNTRGSLQLVRDSKECLVYEASSPNDLAQKILRLLRDRQLRKRLAANGYKLAKKYSWEACSATLLHAYESILP